MYMYILELKTSNPEVWDIEKNYLIVLQREPTPGELTEVIKIIDSYKDRDDWVYFAILRDVSAYLEKQIGTISYDYMWIDMA